MSVSPTDIVPMARPDMLESKGVTIGGGLDLTPHIAFYDVAPPAAMARLTPGATIIRAPPMRARPRRAA